MTHISLGIVENCKNPDSYGTICVRCNQLCGKRRMTITTNKTALPFAEGEGDKFR